MVVASWRGHENQTSHCELVSFHASNFVGQFWRPDEMSYGAMVTSCSTVAEKIIGSLWRFTKRPAFRRTRQWLVYIGIMKETLAKRNGEIDLHIVLQNYQFSHQKKKRYFYLWIMRVHTPPKFNGWNLKIMMVKLQVRKSPKNRGYKDMKISGVPNSSSTSGVGHLFFSYPNPKAELFTGQRPSAFWRWPNSTVAGGTWSR